MGACCLLLDIGNRQPLVFGGESASYPPEPAARVKNGVAAWAAISVHTVKDFYLTRFVLYADIGFMALGLSHYFGLMNKTAEVPCLVRQNVPLVCGVFVLC